jgi:hypothetical protein
VSDRGSLALAPVPLLADNQPGFEVDREALVERVSEAFAGITASEMEALLAIK